MTVTANNNGNLISQRRSSTTSFFLFDALGSTRKLTSSAAAVTDSYDFKAFGEANGTSGSTVNSFLWVGELGYYFDDDRDAYYLRARPYSPTLARFLSLDPIGFAGGDWNLYRYVGNRPVNSTDPTGAAAWEQWNPYFCVCYVSGLGMGVGAGLVGCEGNPHGFVARLCLEAVILAAIEFCCVDACHEHLWTNNRQAAQAHTTNCVENALRRWVPDIQCESE